MQICGEQSLTWNLHWEEQVSVDKSVFFLFLVFFFFLAVSTPQACDSDPSTQAASAQILDSNSHSSKQALSLLREMADSGSRAGNIQGTFETPFMCQGA